MGWNPNACFDALAPGGHCKTTTRTQCAKLNACVRVSTPNVCYCKEDWSVSMTLDTCSSQLACLWTQEVPPDATYWVPNCVQNRCFFAMSSAPYVRSGLQNDNFKFHILLLILDGSHLGLRGPSHRWKPSSRNIQQARKLESRVRYVTHVSSMKSTTIKPALKSQILGCIEKTTLGTDNDDVRHHEFFKNFLRCSSPQYRGFGSDTSACPPKTKSSKAECEDTRRVKKQKQARTSRSYPLQSLHWAGSVFLFILSYSDSQVIFKFLTVSIHPSNVGPSFKCCPILKHVFIIS